MRHKFALRGALVVAALLLCADAQTYVSLLAHPIGGCSGDHVASEADTLFYRMGFNGGVFEMSNGHYADVRTFLRQSRTLIGSAVANRSSRRHTCPWCT